MSRRHRKGESVPVESSDELRLSVREAERLSWTLARTRPGETAWVYRFDIEWEPPLRHLPPVSWTGVRFSAEPEQEVLDEGRRIRLTPIIGFKNGERVSPRTVHNCAHIPAEPPIPNTFVSEELEERWKKIYRKYRQGVDS